MGRPYPHGSQAAPDGELVFGNVACLKRAMTAARNILRTHVPSSRADAACRLISREGQHMAQVLATDGHRLCVLDVTPVRDSPKAAFDVAMPLEAVRAIASAPRTNLVRIGRNDSSCVVAFGREDTAGTTYAPCKTWNVRTYDRIISEEPVYASTAEMPRVEALDALRATTPNEDEDNPNGICRFEIAHDGLRVWPTTCNPAPEAAAPGRKLADKVARFEEPIVFGMRHRHVLETLRTMMGRTVWMVINNATKPVHMGSAGGSERYVLMPFALSGPQPRRKVQTRPEETTNVEDAEPTPATAEPGEASRWDQTAPDGTLVFDDVSRLKRAMSAVRRILRTYDRRIGGGPACQLVAGKGMKTANLFASDGRRMREIRLPLGGAPPADDFELALSLETVRTIATCTGARKVRIGKCGETAVLGVEYATERTTRRQAPAETWMGRTFRRWLKDEPAGVVTASIALDAAIKKIGQWNPRPGEENKDQACRMLVTASGVRIWQTKRATLDADDGPGALLSTRVIRCKRPITFGVYHRMLLDTLRSISGAEGVITVQGPDKSVHMQLKDGAEHYVLMPYRLNE